MEITKIETEQDYKDAVRKLEEIGDDPNYGDRIAEFQHLEALIDAYELVHYHIDKASSREIAKMKLAYKGSVTKVIKRKGSWTVQFAIGGQKFTLDLNGTNKKEAEWMEDRLVEALSSFKAE